MVTILALIVRMSRFLLGLVASQLDPQGAEDEPTATNGQNTQTSIKKASKLNHGYS